MVDRRYPHVKTQQETISDADSPTSSANTVLGLLGGLANRVRAITGKANWTDAPDTTLANSATHHAARNNPHGVTAAQARARPDTYVPSWSEITSKPSTFAPSAHKASHATAGADALAPADIGAAPSHNHPYAPSSHVGSGGTAHAEATTSVSGFITPAEKGKLAALAEPQRVYSTPGWTEQIIDVTANGWQTTMLAPEITVPTLGAAPAGFRWMMDIEGAIRIAPPPSNVSLFLSIGFDRAASVSVDGGGPLFASSQGALSVSRYGIAPPATGRSFTVNFFFWTVVTGSYGIRQGPLPACRCYLVAV